MLAQRTLPPCLGDALAVAHRRLYLATRTRQPVCLGTRYARCVAPLRSPVA